LALCVHLSLRKAWADPFHPDILLSVGHLFQFIIFSIVFATGWFDGMLFPHIEEVRSYFPQMISAVLLGQTAFNAVFCLLPGRRTRRVGWDVEGVSGFVIVLAGFVWLARVAILATGSYWHTGASSFKFESTAFSPMAIIDVLGRIVSAYAGLKLLSGRRSKLAVAYLVCELLWSLFSGGREPLFMLFAVLILVLVFVRGRVPWPVVAGFCVLLVVASAFLASYRDMMYKMPGHSIGKAVQKAMSMQKHTAAKMSLNVVFERIDDGQYAAGCIERAGRTIPYLGGSTYVNIFWVSIPRMLYAGRPVFVVDYNAMFRPRAGGSAPVTTVGEAFLNFGWLGIPVVFFCLGILYWVIDRTVGSPRTLSQAAITVFCASLLIRMAVQPSATYVSWAVKILLLWVGCPWVDAIVAGTIPRWGRMRKLICGRDVKA
jgi:hypothetical protein